ncbi:MAG: hypothetical protein LKCHEGNO_03246 [Burkholderiaceae bacterium]|nr:hypothetical protein [Burkholderiaceae bacterium]
MKHSLWTALVLLAAGPAAWAQPAASAATVYRCPGPPILYTDQISPQEAKDKHCRTIENAPVTIVQMPKPASAKPAPVASGAREGKGDARGDRGDGKVDPAAQRQRDSDARKLLEGELKREEARLAEMQKAFNNGEPERQGDERNFQRYLDRVAEMRSAIARKQEDVAAIKRELAKLPQ